MKKDVEKESNEMNSCCIFERVESVDLSLNRLSHMLNNTALYRKNGISIPRGLLLTGEDEEKHILANELVEKSKRHIMVVNKDSSNNTRAIINAFLDAEEVQQSIILIEDLDELRDIRGEYEPVLNALEACMDECNNLDVFVVATAESEEKIKPSLLYTGYFDFILNVAKPNNKKVDLLVERMLKDADMTDISKSDISKVLGGVSYEKAESILATTLVNCIYEGTGSVIRKQFMDAYFQCGDNPTGFFDYARSNENQELVAWHEAGHCLVSEMLDVGSVCFVALEKRDEGWEGFLKNLARDYDDKQQILDDIARNMAGKACTKTVCGSEDTLCLGDINMAYQMATLVAERLCDFELVSFETTEEHTSQVKRQKIEDMIACILEEQYQRTIEIIEQNRDLLKATHDELIDKGTLFSSDLKRLYDTVER